MQREAAMEQINIHQAKTHLSKLIAKGKEVIIARYGQPVARLVPIKSLKKDRVPGTAKGKIQMKNSFFEPLPDEILNEFYK
jgi:prevent-host-death family protein